MTILLLILQFFLSCLPAALVFMALAFDQEGHRGKGSDLDKKFINIGLVLSLVPYGFTALICWLVFGSDDPVTYTEFRFWLPVFSAMILTPVNFKLVLHAQKVAREKRLQLKIPRE